MAEILYPLEKCFCENKAQTKHLAAASQEDGQICFVNVLSIFLPGPG